MSRLAAVLALTFATTFTLVLIGVEPARAQAVQPANQTQRIVAVTNRFLKTLTPADRQKVQFAYADAQTATPATFKGGKDGRMAFVGEQYGQAVWSNYPTSDVPRPGLALGGMSTTQRAAAMQLLQAMLSPRGYQKVLEIMGSDDALTAQGNPFPTGAGTYTIGIFGTPDPAKPWMVQFGGHHLGLNLTIAGERGVLTPTLTGAQPAVYTAGGKTVRALAHENDKAFAFLAALDKGQREQAVLGYEVKRPGSRTGAIWQDDSAGRLESVQPERAATRTAGGPGRRMGRHRQCAVRAFAHGGDQGGARRNLFRLERPADARARQERQFLLSHPGPEGLHRVLAARRRRGPHHARTHHVQGSDQRLRDRPESGTLMTIRSLLAAACCWSLPAPTRSRRQQAPASSRPPTPSFRR
jgi:hypothetical protein